MKSTNIKDLSSLISNIIDNKISITIGIQKAKKLNADFRDLELGKFLDSEISGVYDKCPTYRIIASTPIFEFKNPFNGRIEKIENPLRIDEAYTKQKIQNPISGLEEMKSQLAENNYLIVAFTTKELNLFDSFIQDSHRENDGWHFHRGYWKIQANYVTSILHHIKDKLIEHLTRIEKSSSPDSRKSLFFSNNTEFDSTLEIINAIKVASKEIKLVDNYVDENTLKLLSACEEKVDIKILTKPSSIKPHMELLVDKFIKQHNFIEIKSTTNIHDRFLIIDGNKFYSIGASLKDAGNKAFMFTKIEDTDTHNHLTEKFNKEWS
jgi:hypothetical protein